MPRYNRIKVVLAEAEKTNNWLANELGKSYVTVSRWCSNQAQPNVETLYRIAEVLDVEVHALLRSREEVERDRPPPSR